VKNLTPYVLLVGFEAASENLDPYPLADVHAYTVIFGAVVRFPTARAAESALKLNP
jgi:hypothetical protein